MEKTIGEGKTPSNVKAKQGKYRAFSEKMRREARALLKDGKEKMAAAVSQFNQEIRSQRTENEMAVKKINSGVEKLQGKIKTTQGKFRAFPREVKAYSKEFWGE